MIEEKTVETFPTAAKSIRLHEPTILNDFVNRSTKAATGSLTAKLLNFRVLVCGVREFHVFIIAKPLWLTCLLYDHWYGGHGPSALLLGVPAETCGFFKCRLLADIHAAGFFYQEHLKIQQAEPGGV